MDGGARSGTHSEGRQGWLGEEDGDTVVRRIRRKTMDEIEEERRDESGEQNMDGGS